MSTDFLNFILNNGCKHLDLQSAMLMVIMPLKDGININKTLQLRSLNLFDCKDNSLCVLEELLGSCYSLQELSLSCLQLDTHIFYRVCTQNCKTLQVLDMSFYKGLDLTTIMLIVDLCVELREINLDATFPSDASINYLVNNLTPKISKFSLKGSDVLDEHVNTLVSRCNKLTTLDLGATKITNNSVTSIIDHLKHNLEELYLTANKIHLTKLLELRSMPKLKALKCSFRKGSEGSDGQNLKKQIPFAIVYEDVSL